MPAFQLSENSIRSKKWIWYSSGVFSSQGIKWIFTVVEFDFTVVEFDCLRLFRWPLPREASQVQFSDFPFHSSTFYKIPSILVVTKKKYDVGRYLPYSLAG